MRKLEAAITITLFVLSLFLFSCDSKPVIGKPGDAMGFAQLLDACGEWASK